MKKMLFLLIGLFIFSHCGLLSAKPVTENRHAVVININGMGPGVDAAAYKKLRQLIGSAVARNVIDKFVIFGYAREGGFMGCIEERPTQLAPSRAFERLVAQLTALKPNPSTTAYSVERFLTCPVANTVRVAKSDGGLQCENNAISLSDMQAQLTGIVVYKASKESDGFMYPSVCGANAGRVNVYDIASSDLPQALALGFVEWSPAAP